MAKGDLTVAHNEFRSALKFFKELDLPIEAASTRLRIAKTLRLDGDRDGADIEIDTARRIFKPNQADCYCQLCDELRYLASVSKRIDVQEIRSG